MKVNAKILKKFVDKASLNGTIMSILLNFKEEELVCAVRNYEGNTMTVTKMKKDSFKEYTPFGELWVKDAMALSKALNSFDNEITIEKSKQYQLDLTDIRREGFIILGSKEVFDNNVDENLEKEMKITAEALFKKSDVAIVVKDMTDLTKENKVLIEQKNGMLSFIAGEKGVSDAYKTKIINDSLKGESRFRLGMSFKLFVDAVNIDGEITMKSATDLPVVLKEKSEFIDFTCIIAPRVENE